MARVAIDRRALLAGLLMGTGALLLPGCGDDETGIPQPVPIPSPRVDLLRATGAPPAGEGTIQLLGLPGCVPGVGRITVEMIGASAQTESTSYGSFGLGLEASAGDVLVLRFKDSPDTSRFTVEAESPNEIVPPGPIAGVPQVSLAGGTVTVRGKFVVDETMIALNLRSGDVGVTRSLADSTFQVELPGQSGDRLRIYGDGAPLGPAWELTVP
jgi:hypothetical protein